MPWRTASRGEPMATAGAVDLEPHRGATLEAGEAPREPRAAGADEAGQADDLAAMELDRRRRPARPMRDADRRRSPVRRRQRGACRHVVADHVPDQRRRIELGDRRGHDLAAVAQHRHAVGDREDLVEPVGHEEDQQAFRFSAATTSNSASRSASDSTAVGSSRMRMRASTRQRARQLDELLRRRRSARRRAVRGRARGPIRASTRRRRAPPAVDQAEARARLAAEEDVVGDAELRQRPSAPGRRC